MRVLVAALVLTGPALLQMRGHGRLLRRSGRTLLVYGFAAVAGAQLCFSSGADLLVAVEGCSSTPGRCLSSATSGCGEASGQGC